MKGFVVRPGRIEEAEIARGIERLAGQRFAWVGMPEIAASPPTAEADLVERASDGRLLLAEVGGEAVGFVIWSLLDGHAHVDEIGVLPKAAGQGLGAALLDAVAAAAWGRGLAALTLSTLRSVPWNAPWYTRLGFLEVEPETLGPGHVAGRARQTADGLDPAERVWMLRLIMGREGQPTDGMSVSTKSTAS